LLKSYHISPMPSENEIRLPPMVKCLSTILLLLLQFHAPHVFGQNQQNSSTNQRAGIYSEILQEQRTFHISLPDSYDASAAKRYPVMILLDGYNHFKLTSGIIHFMSANRVGNNMAPEMILVAIDNVDRERDFTVTKIKTVRPNTMGGGQNFLDFIEKELIPYIDNTYRTEAYRILTGHSLGGLLAVNAYANNTSIFDAFISIDPSIWWNEQMMIEKVNAIPTSSFHKKLYLTTANQGAANVERNKKRHDALYRLLTARSEDPQNIRIHYFEHEDHRSVPLKAIYEGLRFIYESDNT
jgi:predicted alpha/beta superfamily hydrolase